MILPHPPLYNLNKKRPTKYFAVPRVSLFDDVQLDKSSEKDLAAKPVSVVKQRLPS